MNQSPLTPEQEQTLAQWIGENMPSDAEFARRVGMKKSHLSLVLQGKRGTSARVSASIERETGGLFTAARLERERGRFGEVRTPSESAEVAQ